MKKGFSGCEVVELGVQIEKNGMDFYLAVAKKVKDKKLAAMFVCLADLEKGHIDVFRALFNSACEYEPPQSYNEEYFSYMRALASQYVFTEKGAGVRAAKKVKGRSDILSVAIGFEKDSILFYEGMMKMVRGEDRHLIEKVLEEEKSHLKQLLEIKGE